MKQILKEDDIAGKTILKVAYSGCDCFVMFTDDTFCWLHSADDEASILFVADEEFDLAPDYWNCRELFAMGIITKEERNKIIENENIKVLERTERQQRETYEKLKQRFESATHNPTAG